MDDIVAFVGCSFGCQDFWKYENEKRGYPHSLLKFPRDITPNTGMLVILVSLASLQFHG